MTGAGSLNRRLRLLAVVVLAAFMGAVFFLVPSGVYVVAPGTVDRVAPMVEVLGSARTEKERGAFMMTTVAIWEASLASLMWRSFQSESDLISKDYLLPPGKGFDDFALDAREQMKESKAIATLVAVRRAGSDGKVGSSGVEVRSVFPGTPAVEKLRSGDLITAAWGRPVQFEEDIWSTVRDGLVSLTLQRGERTLEVELQVGDLDGQGGLSFLGVEAVSRDVISQFPLEIRIVVEEAIGPSAGLMFALEIIDRLDGEGDLTGGRLVAGTGVLWPSGRVIPIGGAKQKALAARRAGAVDFLVPALNFEEASAVAGDMRVVPVENIDDALAYLKERR